MNLKGTLPPLILEALAREPNHGYRIAQQIKACSTSRREPCIPRCTSSKTKALLRTRKARKRGESGATTKSRSRGAARWSRLGIYRPSRQNLARRDGCANPLHRASQPLAKCLRRKLQRHAAPRTHQPRTLFAALADARVRTETWRRYYNTERRHTSLGYRTPQQYFEQSLCVNAPLLGALPPNPQELPH